MLGNLDIKRQLPKRHGFRRGEAFPHLFRGQIGIEPVGRLIAWCQSSGINRCVFELPEAGLQHGGLCLDSLLKLPAGRIAEYRYAAQTHTLFLARKRVDDRLAIGGTLTYPISSAVADQSRTVAKHLRFETLGLLLQTCRKRVVERGCNRSEDQRAHDRWRYELPSRHPCRARNDQFHPSR